MTGKILVHTTQVVVTEGQALRFSEFDIHTKQKLKTAWSECIPNTAISISHSSRYNLGKTYELRGAFLDEQQVIELLQDLAELAKLRERFYNDR